MLKAQQDGLRTLLDTSLSCGSQVRSSSPWGCRRGAGACGDALLRTQQHSEGVYVPPRSPASCTLTNVLQNSTLTLRFITLRSASSRMWTMCPLVVQRSKVETVLEEEAILPAMQAQLAGRGWLIGCLPLIYSTHIGENLTRPCPIQGSTLCNWGIQTLRSTKSMASYR